MAPVEPPPPPGSGFVLEARGKAALRAAERRGGIGSVVGGGRCLDSAVQPTRVPLPILMLMPKARLLCTGAESNLGDRVLGEVEKNSFIALPGKGGHSRLVPLKIMCPNLGKFGEVF